MPQALQVEVDPTVADLVALTRTDGYYEVLSTLGYGVLVVTEARKDELVATGEWTDITPA